LSAFWEFAFRIVDQRLHGEGMSEADREAKKRIDRLTDSPVFLVGAERSGTTLLRLMLDSHPEISFMEEFEYSVEYIPTEGWPEIDGYVEWLAVNRVFQLHGPAIDRTLDYPALVNSFLEQQLDHSARVFGATIHFSIDRLLRVWPNARFIHIVRDPRDVARSAVAMAWGGTVWGGVQKWIQSEDEWQATKALLAQDRFIEVTFHDLVNDHRAVLDRICAFVSVDYTDEMLSYAERTEYALPNPAGASSWETSSSNREIRLVEAKVGHRLASGGFSSSGLPEMAISSRRQLMLDAESKFKRPLVQTKVLGWPLSLGLTVARQFGTRSIRAWFERQEDVKINANRKRSWS